MANTVDGQTLIERIEAWFRSFVVYPEQTPDAPLVVALFVVNSWIYQVWSSVPYLSFQAATKGAGKSVSLELAAMLSKNAELVAGPTAASLFRLAETHQGWMSLYFDEAEKLSKDNASAGTMRDLLNPGYRAGATMPRAAKGGEGAIKFPVYWPKAFALIGDLYSTLRDRSIIIPLQRATPHQLATLEKRYRRDAAEREASAIVPLIERWSMEIMDAPRMPVIEADWHSGREEELWTPLYSTAHLLGLNAATLKRFKMVSADLSALKSQDAVYYTNAQRAEDEARDRSYGERAVSDLARVLREGERGVPSADAVQRMKALPDGPWRTFKGSGLNEVLLGRLVSRFDLKSDRLPCGRNEKQVRGYRRADIVRAAKL